MESVCSSCQDNQPMVNSELREAVRADDAFLTAPGQEEGRKTHKHGARWAREVARLHTCLGTQGIQELSWTENDTFSEELYKVQWKSVTNISLGLRGSWRINLWWYHIAQLKAQWLVVAQWLGFCASTQKVTSSNPGLQEKRCCCCCFLERPLPPQLYEWILL